MKKTRTNSKGKTKRSTVSKSERLLTSTPKSPLAHTYAHALEASALERLVQRYEVSRTEVMAALLPAKTGTLLDLACGDGALLKRAAAKFRRVIGYDISAARLRRAELTLAAIGKRSPQVTLHSCDLDQGIPLKSASVDAVTCEASLSCFQRPDLLLDEVHRVLKPHGVFVVQIANYAFLPRRLALLVGKLPKISSFTGFGDGGMFHHFTYQSLRELLREHGFHVRRQANSGVAAPVRQIWPSLLAGDIIYLAEKITSRNAN